MLRSFVFGFFLLFSVSATAQVWFDIAPKILFGYNGYLNSDVFGDRGHDVAIRGNGSFGGRLGVNFGANHGIQFEALYANHDQEVTFTDNSVMGNPMQIGNQLSWTGTELGLFYRHLASIVYFEVGPKFNMMNDITQQIGGDIIEPSIVEANYEDSYASAVFGFGGYFVGNESVALSLGLRLEYALQPINTAAGTAAGFPTPYTEYGATIADTRPLAVQLVAEFSFGLGGVAKAGCGQRTFVFGQRFY